MTGKHSLRLHSEHYNKEGVPKPSHYVADTMSLSVPFFPGKWQPVRQIAGEVAPLTVWWFFNVWLFWCSDHGIQSSADYCYSDGGCWWLKHFDCLSLGDFGAQCHHKVPQPFLPHSSEHFFFKRKYDLSVFSVIKQLWRSGRCFGKSNYGWNLIRF